MNRRVFLLYLFAQLFDEVVLSQLWPFLQRFEIDPCIDNSKFQQGEEHSLVPLS